MVKTYNIELYKNGILLKTTKTKTDIIRICIRGEIKGFSKKSAKRLGWVYAQYAWLSMITLTYHKKYPDGKESKNHLHRVLDLLKKKGIVYLWVLEWQGRGFPHYHIWLDRLFEDEEWHFITKAWLRATCNYNDTEESKLFHMHPAIYTPWDVRFDLNYACKYANKHLQKWLPIGVDSFGKWFGHTRNIIVPERGFIIDNTDDTDMGECVTKEFTEFRRNVKRCIFHWSRRKKKSKFDKKTNQGFRYTLNDSRKDCINRLYDYAIKEVTEKSDVYINKFIFNKIKKN